MSVLEIHCDAFFPFRALFLSFLLLQAVAGLPVPVQVVRLVRLVVVLVPGMVPVCEGVRGTYLSNKLMALRLAGHPVSFFKTRAF